MGKAYSHFVRRPVQNYNIEERAFKALEKMDTMKPPPAPRHETSSKYIDDFVKENPDVAEEQMKRPDTLLRNMQNMTANPDKVAEISAARSLPTDRKPFSPMEFGYQEPEVIPPGKVSIKQVLELISMRLTDPDKYSVDYIAKNYNLQADQVERLVKYYQIFKIQMPEGSKAKQYLEEHPDFGAKPFFSKENNNILPSGKDT